MFNSKCCCNCIIAIASYYQNFMLKSCTLANNSHLFEQDINCTVKLMQTYYIELELQCGEVKIGISVVCMG